MTREDLKRQVLGRVKAPAEFCDMAETLLADRLKLYPLKFSFGPQDVLSEERLLRRELNFAQRMAAAKLRNPRLGAKPE